MKRRMLIALLLLPLTSCIPVEDFGAYWDRTGLDPQIKGKWKWIAAPCCGMSPEDKREQGFPIGDVSELVEKDGAYELVKRPAAATFGEDQPMWPVKTLATGRHRWLVLGRQHAQLVEYQVDGAYLDICALDYDEMAEFIRRRYPGAPNLETSRGSGPSVSIRLFDATAFALLRDYPGADGCAERSVARYEKVR